MDEQLGRLHGDCQYLNPWLHEDQDLIQFKYLVTLRTDKQHYFLRHPDQAVRQHADPSLMQTRPDCEQLKSSQGGSCLRMQGPTDPVTFPTHDQSVMLEPVLTDLVKGRTTTPS